MLNASEDLRMELGPSGWIYPGVEGKGWEESSGWVPQEGESPLLAWLVAWLDEDLSWEH